MPPTLTHVEHTLHLAATTGVALSPARCAQEFRRGTGITQGDNAPGFRLAASPMYGYTAASTRRLGWELTKPAPRRVCCIYRVLWQSTDPTVKPSSLYSLSRRAQPDPISPGQMQFFFLTKYLHHCTSAKEAIHNLYNVHRSQTLLHI